MVRFLRIYPVVSASSPPSAKLSLSVGIARRDHIERKDLEIARKAKASPCPLQMYKKYSSVYDEYQTYDSTSPVGLMAWWQFENVYILLTADLCELKL